MLEVENLDLHYGQSRILYEVSFQAPKGQITTLIGNNGVGKTSTLKAIAGRHPASAGTITVDGTPVRLTTAFQAANVGIAYVPQGHIEPNVIQQIGDALRLLRTQGEMAIVLVEQNADFAYALGDSFIVVEGGRNGPRKLKADYTKDMLIADLAL